MICSGQEAGVEATGLPDTLQQLNDEYTVDSGRVADMYAQELIAYLAHSFTQFCFANSGLPWSHGRTTSPCELEARNIRDMQAVSELLMVCPVVRRCLE